MYLDRDGDLDLTDEEPLKPLAETPDGLLMGYSQSLQETCFVSIKIPCDFGPAGVLPVELVPRLWIREGGYAVLAFVPAKVRRGAFAIAGQEYEACLGYQRVVGGRFDRPGTLVFLARQDDDPARWWGAHDVQATVPLAGQFYRFACTPTGEELTLLPYDGPLGTFELGAGDREVAKLEIRGSLRAEETSVAVKKGREYGRPRPTRTCEIPVGDYYPGYLTVTLGSLQLAISNNYHANAQGQSRSERDPVRGITIREDKPYVLDFSNKSEVIFVHPAKEQRVTLGEELRVEAVMVDPVLDIMFRRLYSISDSGQRTSLDPKVVIKRADGEVVAEGAMPFG